MTILSNHLLTWVMVYLKDDSIFMWTILTIPTLNTVNVFKKNTYKCQLLQQPLLQGGDRPFTEKWKGEIATSK